MNESPARVIRGAARRFGAAPALVEVSCPPGGDVRPGRAVTFADLHEQTLRLCAALEHAGVSVGDRIAVLLDNSIELVVTEWACLTAGFVWVALNTRASAAEIAAILDDSRPSVLVTDERRASDLASGPHPPRCRVLTVGSEWASLLAGASPNDSPVEPESETPVRIRYTSGTAGRPKGAVLPRRSYDASIEAVTGVLAPLRRSDAVVQVAPMTHAAGAMLLPHVAVGARALLVDRFDARAFFRIVEAERATAAFLVPTMLVRVLEALDDPRRLASLRAIVYGGASMPVEPLVRGLELLGPVFVQIYGLTESTWPVTALTREDHVRRPGEDVSRWRARLASCGRPTAVGRVRVVDRHGSDVRDGETGEICVRGRNTMLGYWSRPETAPDRKGLDSDGWMHTGDVGFRDAEGYVTIVDRLHDMIVSGGFNVYPREVEDALCSHPAVLEAAVVGRPHPEWGETVHAAVVLKPGAAVTSAALVEHCARSLAGYKKPRSLDVVDSLPRNAAGKILRRALREPRG